MTTFVQGHEIIRPDTTPLGSSILDHATVIDNVDHFGLVNNAGLWLSYNCLDTLTPTAICPAPTEEKEFSFAPWIPGFEFSVYGGVQCKAPGLDVADQKAEIKRVFTLNEGKGVERALLENRFVATTPGDIDSSNLNKDVQWDEPDDLTPVGANGGDGINVKTALALLEGYAATQYAGVPTIHMPRAAVSLISDMVQWRQENGVWKAYTPAGSKVAVGGGYDQDTLPLTGKLDLFATGEVYIEKGEQVDVSAYVLPGDGATQDDNTHIALVERSFRVAVDCFVAKATGTLWT